MLQQGYEAAEEAFPNSGSAQLPPGFQLRADPPMSSGKKCCRAFFLLFFFLKQQVNLDD